MLVAEQLPAHAQLSRFAADLEPLLGVRPDLPDVATLFRVLFRVARDRKLLVVIDEFPWLLSPVAADAFRDLTTIQAAMEDERDRSRIKLVLCGSHVGQMEALFGERNPMHGRLRRLAVRPLSFGEAAPFFDGLDSVAAFERFAVSGGMPMYLSRLAEGRLREAVCRNVLDRDAPLWNEGRVIVDQELREPRVYFAMLEQLATGAKALNEIAKPLDMTTGAVAKYLSTLIDLRLVSKKEPFGADPRSRSGRWQLDDAFLRFWFRFVFPFQADLDAGLPARTLFDTEVQPALGDHVAQVFEGWALEWLRANRGCGRDAMGQLVGERRQRVPPHQATQHRGDRRCRCATRTRDRDRRSEMDQHGTHPGDRRVTSTPTRSLPYDRAASRLSRNPESCCSPRPVTPRAW